MSEDNGRDRKDDIEPLFHLAGRRPRLPDREVERIRETAREAWRRQVRRTAWRRRAVWIGAAAAAGVLLAAGLVLRERQRPSEPAGTLEVRIGEVFLKGNRASQPGALVAGAVIETRRGRAALRLASASVRVDVDSALRIDSAHELTLQRGAVYVDSGKTVQGTSPLAISTVLGSVRHTGTQFEVRFAGTDTLRVRVREGAVLIDRAGKTYETRAGDELTLRSDGEARRSPVPAHGPAWDWTQRTAPALAIEGAPLAKLLDWVSRETGRRWVYSDATLEQATQDVILHGSIAGLTPEEALSIVLPGCGFKYRRAAEAFLLERDDTP